MKTFKIFLVVLMAMMFTLSFNEKTETLIEASKNETALQVEKPDPPCGETGFDILLHFSEKKCKGYGLFWWNNKCIICR